MTPDTINLITDAVRTAIKPDLDAIHSRVTQLATTASAINERLKHTPTKAEMAEAIGTHATSCASGRRWMWGIVLGVPTALLAIWGIVSAIGG